MTQRMTYVSLIHYWWQIIKRKYSFINEMLLILETLLQHIYSHRFHLEKYVTDEKTEVKEGLGVSMWQSFHSNSCLQSPLVTVNFTCQLG